MTAADLLGRYGAPGVQRFAVNGGILLAVEYSENGHVVSVEIVPEASKRDMARRDVSRLLAYFVTDQIRDRLPDSLECPGRGNDSTGEFYKRCSWTATSGAVTLLRVHEDDIRSPQRDSSALITTKDKL